MMWNIFELSTSNYIIEDRLKLQIDEYCIQVNIFKPNFNYANIGYNILNY